MVSAPLEERARIDLTLPRRAFATLGVAAFFTARSLALPRCGAAGPGGRNVAVCRRGLRHLADMGRRT
jgi:hypothetical protein